MKTAAKLISLVALAGTIVPPLMFVEDAITLADMQLAMLAATVAWFATAPLWMDAT